MADYRNWATINHAAPGEFVVTVSGVPDDLASPERARVSMLPAPSHGGAIELAADLVRQMGQRLRHSRADYASLRIAHRLFSIVLYVALESMAIHAFNLLVTVVMLPAG